MSPFFFFVVELKNDDFTQASNSLFYATVVIFEFEIKK